jgi:CBS domain-containing protein
MKQVPHQISDVVARDIMSSPGIACREEAWFEEVAELLADREISGVPVVNDEGEVTGVVSERDLAYALGSPLVRLSLRRPIRTGPFLRPPRGVAPGASRARDIMTSPAVIAHPDTPIRALAQIMVKKGLNRIPIVSSGRLVGVVTRTDVLGAVAGLDRRHVAIDQPPVVVGSVWNEVKPTGFVFGENREKELN